jgi:hypothetical protein
MDINGSDGLFCHQIYSAIGDTVYVMWTKGKDCLTIMEGFHANLQIMGSDQVSHTTLYVY